MQPALASIDEAIEANKNIPDELYFAPKNLAIKAEIMARLGNTKGIKRPLREKRGPSGCSSQQGSDPHHRTPTLSELSVVYAGYFVSLSDQGKLADAFRVIERARGRVEAQALAHHEVIPPHEPNPAEQHLTKPQC